MLSSFYVCIVSIWDYQWKVSDDTHGSYHFPTEAKEPPLHYRRIMGYASVQILQILHSIIFKLTFTKFYDNHQSYFP